jgi:hypothetical protein
VCIFTMNYNIHSKYLRNQIIKLCMDACRLCIIQCSKYRKVHKECMDCYNACIECIDYCQNILI